jgi:RNase H-like domain found in reverse transcriptase
MPPRVPKYRGTRQYSVTTWTIHAQREAQGDLGTQGPKRPKKLETFLGLAVYFSWMANPLFKNLRQKDSPFSWTNTHQTCFEFIKLALVSTPVRGHPEQGQAYRLYTDASEYAIAGALQQIQYMTIKDLKGTRVHKRLSEAYKKGEKVPDLVARLSKEFDDRHPTPNWSDNWEDTRIPVERVVAYWSRVLASAETRYSATEREVLAAKESLVHFQP